ncbi:ATP-binding protein [Planctomycetia bacterium]|nr:ATP-binding protein [Planctomycetia bacterium]
MANLDYEKLGEFYLGKHYDLAAQQPKPELLLYDAKDLTTHAVVVGMTGSGKTGLCLSLLEEAAIDGVPALIIDPKGDLGNLLLTFPKLQADDFRPWVDASEATRRGLTPDQFAADSAKTWKDGLAAWGQDPSRIKKFREACDVAIYTPGSQAGLPLTVVRSFGVPPQAVLENSDAMRERVNGAAAGLLALLGIDADPIRSREHILLTNIFDRAWREGQSLDLGQLIREIQSPSFKKVGVLDLDTFYPATERFSLAMTLNNLLASPGFSAWMEGEALDIQRLLWTTDGKPRLSIMSISHLSDSERMFFVTIFLNEVLAWMRSQSGTSSLRCLLYMDEVFGYFPPTANPPSKTPMLTLLKQARAFGLGVVLATQNPVDLDYKGLSNCGTWFLGRLQTERDKARVLEGLEGASASTGMCFDRAAMDSILSGLGKRVFVMNNVHDDAPSIFQTRWSLSYLRGPLSRDQIDSLMRSRRESSPSTSSTTIVDTAAASADGVSEHRPVLSPDIVEFFIPTRREPDSGDKFVYRPALLGIAKAHFVKSTVDVDVWDSISILASVADEISLDPWDDGELSHDGPPDLEKTPVDGAAFASLPADLAKPKKYATLTTALKDHLYRVHRLTVWKCKSPKAVSRADENEGDFRSRLSQVLREERDLAVEKLRQKYAPKVAALQEQLRKAEQRKAKEEEQAKTQTWGTMLTVGSSLLGAFLGKKTLSVTNVGKAATAARSAGKLAKERTDIGYAEENVEAVQARLTALDAEFHAETEKLATHVDPTAIELEELTLQPKKADITISQVALVWTPWSVAEGGTASLLA